MSKATTSKINNISSDAVQKATGKNWDEWLELLDNAGSAKKTHKEIAKWLYDEKLITNGWWCQMVTVGYEYARGRRVVGQTEESEFEVGVSKTFPLLQDQAWKLLTSPKGLKIWLGDIDRLKLEGGFAYKTKDNITGEVRSFTNEQKIRLTYQPPDRKKPSILQITLLPSGEKTAIHFHQEKLTGTTDRNKMREHWKNVLARLEKLI